MEKSPRVPKTMKPRFFAPDLGKSFSSTAEAVRLPASLVKVTLWISLELVTFGMSTETMSAILVMSFCFVGTLARVATLDSNLVPESQIIRQIIFFSFSIFMYEVGLINTGNDR